MASRMLIANRIGLESLSIRSGTEESWRSA